METYKICTECNISKKLSDFNNHKKTKDGKTEKCKKCISGISMEYRRSVRGIASKIYNSQKKASIARGHKSPNYTLEDLRTWLYTQKKFDELYLNWVKSEYKKDFTPSVDRIDDYKSYTLDNIQLMTFRENLDKASSDIKNGVNNKLSKAVIQYSMDNVFIKEFYSLHEAERQTGIDCRYISRVCLGKKNSTCGFKWSFKDEK